MPNQLVVLPARREHPAGLLLRAGRAVRDALPVLIGLTIWARYWWLFLIAGLGVLTAAVLGWWFTRYGVSNGVLRRQSGFFRRSVQTVPLGRITAVNADRGLIQRIFGLWAVTVRTPGDSEVSAVRMSCLTQSALEELRAALGTTPGLHEAEADPGRVVATLSTGRLLLAAVTGTTWPVLLAGVGVVWSRAEEFLPGQWRDVVREVMFRGGRWVLSLLALLVVTLIASTVISALRMARFTLVRRGDQLRFSRGLLSQRSGSIAVDRIQAVRYVQGFLRLPFGLGSLEVEVSGVAGEGEGDRLLFPLIPRSQVPVLLAAALPELDWVEPEPLPRRVRRRYPTVPVGIGAALAAALAWLLPAGWWWLPATVLVVAVAIGLAQWQAAAMVVTDGSIGLRWHRVLSRHTLVARRRRVQLTEVRSTWWQRRGRVAGLRLRLSSGRDGRLRHVEESVAAAVQHRVGRAVLARAE